MIRGSYCFEFIEHLVYGALDEAQAHKPDQERHAPRLGTIDLFQEEGCEVDRREVVGQDGRDQLLSLLLIPIEVVRDGAHKGALANGYVSRKEYVPKIHHSEVRYSTKMGPSGHF